jgi:hypothetical protein
MNFKFIKNAVVLLIALAFCHSANAHIVRNLYNSDSQIADNTAESRDKYLPQAFSQVLLKVSGSKAILSHPELAEAKQHVDKYINSYSYSGDTDNYKISVKFNEKMVNELLAKLGSNTLSKNRPLVLLWLVVESNNDAHFVGGGVHEDISDKLENLSQAYGVPLSLPILDLPERMLITENDVKEFKWGALKQSVSRYRANLVVAGKITNQAGVWHTQWQLLDGDQTLSWDTTGNDLNAQLEQMVDHLSTQAVARYTQGQKTLDVGNKSLVLNVKGINNLEDYARVMNYLQAVALIKKVEVSNILDNEATFLLTTDVGKDSIAKALSLETLLIADASAQTGEQDGLVYKVGS